jgi:hypothetical protein
MSVEADEYRRGWYAGQQAEKRLHEQTRAEVVRLRADIEQVTAQRDQAMAWDKRRVEEFTGTLAQVVASAEAEMVLVSADRDQRDREQRATALREAARCMPVSEGDSPCRYWLRAEADRIEAAQ